MTKKKRTKQEEADLHKALDRTAKALREDVAKPPNWKAKEAKVEYRRDEKGEVRTRVTMGAPTNPRQHYAAIAKIAETRTEAKQRQRLAQMGDVASKSRRENRAEQDRQILEAVETYRQAHPKRSLRRIAHDVAQSLGMNPETLRKRLRSIQKNQK